MDSQIIFQVRMTLPGEKLSSSAVITGEQMTATIDKAFARGEYKGWCSAMRAVREAVDAAGTRIPEDVMQAAAKRAPRAV